MYHRLDTIAALDRHIEMVKQYRDLHAMQADAR